MTATGILPAVHFQKMIYSALHKLRISHYFGKKLLTEKFILFRLFYAIFRKIDLSRRIQINGKTFIIFLKKGIGISNFFKDYELWMDQWLPKLINNSGHDVFIDIGANTGQTLLKVQSHFPNIPYYAIEPNKHCVDYLHDLCEVNQFSHVRILNYALADRQGETELLMRYPDDLLATTSPSFRKYTRYSSKMKVPMISGDSLIDEEKLKNISVIKIDVEGGEAKVIDGLRQSIQRFQPYIICEVLPLNSKDKSVSNYRRSSARHLMETLESLDYAIFNIHHAEQIFHIDELSSSLESSNYLFLPKNKIKAIFTP